MIWTRRGPLSALGLWALMLSFGGTFVGCAHMQPKPTCRSKLPCKKDCKRNADKPCCKKKADKPCSKKPCSKEKADKPCCKKKAAGPCTRGKKGEDASQKEGDAEYEGAALLPMTGKAMGALMRSESTPALVSVWSTWCAPCIKELPEWLVQLEPARAKGLRWLVVSMDAPGQHGDAQQALGKMGIDFQTYVKDGSDQDFIAGLDARWDGGLPANMLWTPGVSKPQLWEGEMDADTLMEAVNAAMESSK